jgi:hypothetical protein
LWLSDGRWSANNGERKHLLVYLNDESSGLYSAKEKSVSGSKTNICPTLEAEKRLRIFGPYDAVGWGMLLPMINTG